MSYSTNLHAATAPPLTTSPHYSQQALLCGIQILLCFSPASLNHLPFSLQRITDINTFKTRRFYIYWYYFSLFVLRFFIFYKCICTVVYNSSWVNCALNWQWMLGKGAFQITFLLLLHDRGVLGWRTQMGSRSNQIQALAICILQCRLIKSISLASPEK